MNKYLKYFIEDIDLMELQFQSLKLYHEVLNDKETLSSLERDLQDGYKMSDVEIEYEEISIHLNNEQTILFLKFILRICKDEIGYYKTQYSINDESFVDDFLIIY